MKKSFCDNCGNEALDKTYKATETVRLQPNNLSVEVQLAAVPVPRGEDESADLCLECARKALKTVMGLVPA